MYINILRNNFLIFFNQVYLRGRTCVEKMMQPGQIHNIAGFLGVSKSNFLNRHGTKQLNISNEKIYLLLLNTNI